MRKTRDVLTCLFGRNLSNRQTALSLGVHHSTVGDYYARFIRSGLPWPLPVDMDDPALEACLFPAKETKKQSASTSHIDYADVHTQMQKKGATLMVLHLEWLERAPSDQHLGYSQFCKGYRAWRKSQRISMRRVEVYGETAYVDYSGATINITNPETGEVKSAQVFIGVLGGSSYTYCEVTWTQRTRDWIGSHIRMFVYFGGVPRVIVPDNLKSAVTKADRHSPVINETYQAMCRYYHVTPFPARPYKPKDKPRAEGAVLLAQRRILFVLRRRKFFSLEEANREIRVLLDRLNHKPFQKREGSRFSQWQECELPALQALPATPYEVAEWGKVRAGMDYHVLIDRHYYSVPYQLRGREFEYRMTDKAIDLICKGKTVVLHQRSNKAGGTTTLDEHKSPAHQAVQQTDEDALSWAAEVGPNTVEVMRLQLGKGNAHLMVYRITQSMKSLAKAHTPSRLEEACTYALANRITDVPSIRNILSKQLDKLFSPSSSAAEDSAAHKVIHENIRGAQYYDHILNSDEEKQSC